MNNIKFRIWDTEEAEFGSYKGNGWIYPISLVPGNVRDKELASTLMLCFLQDGSIRFGHDTVCTVVKEHYVKSVSPIDIKNSNRFIIQQFTGITDKNGKEIYVGDIIKIGNSIIGDVRFDFNAFGVRDEKLNEFNFLCSYKYEEDVELEVVGNILQDKELLKCDRPKNL